MFNEIWFEFPRRVSLKTFVLLTPCVGFSYPQGVHAPLVKNHCSNLKVDKKLDSIPNNFIWVFLTQRKDKSPSYELQHALLKAFSQGTVVSVQFYFIEKNVHTAIKKPRSRKPSTQGGKP